MTDTEIPASPHRARPVDWEAKARAWGIEPDTMTDADQPEPVDGPMVEGCDRHHRDDACTGSFRLAEQDGPMWLARCDGCQVEVTVPARGQDPSIARRGREERAGFPDRFLASPFVEDQANRPTLDRLRSWNRQYDHSLPAKERLATLIPGPALYGNAGTGKSHLLVTTCRALIRDHDLAVMFRSVARLLDELQDGFDKQGEYARIWELALTVPILALDDVGAQQLTEWRADRLARLVDERWERLRPVLIATNYHPDDWEHVMDERTRSRLLGMTFPVELRGPDRRQLGFNEPLLEEDAGVSNNG